LFPSPIRIGHRQIFTSGEGRRRHHNQWGEVFFTLRKRFSSHLIRLTKVAGAIIAKILHDRFDEVATMREGEPELAEVLSIIDAIYETVLTPASWPRALELISKHIGEGCAGISLIDTHDYSIKVAAHWGASDAFMRDLAETVSFNPASNAHWYRDIDDPFSVEQLIGKHAFRSTRFYREVAAKHDYPDALTSILSKTGDRAGTISLPRSSAHGPITARDVMRLRRLAPHIRRAVLLTDMLETSAVKENLLNQTLDLLRTPILLVDARQRIVQANAAAEDVLAKGAGMRRAGDTLKIDDERAATAFAASLDQLQGVLPGPASRNASADNTFVVVGEGSAQEHALWLLPLSAVQGSHGVGKRAKIVAVLISEASQAPSSPGEIFASRYKLTPGECRVLAQLLSGATPATAAKHLGVSINTVRSHMQKLFAKTGCNGLTEMLHAASRLLPPFR
jgi:DNA-binding CsgD family transcriptional regulator